VTGDLDELRSLLPGTLPGWFGMEITVAEPGRLEARFDLRPEFDAPNGYLHAATIVALADSCCGLGCRLTLPEGATGFTTIELKTNFLRTARPGDGLRCRATSAHAGRTTQVWDAEVERESDGQAVALFRCTQLVLMDRPR
jgi:uncharacterized protein (TIGR00369 family)